MNTPNSNFSDPKATPIGSNAKRIRESKGFPMEVIAEAIGLDTASYSLFEANNIVLNEDLLPLLAKVLGVSNLDLVKSGNQQRFPSDNQVDIEKLEQLYLEQINLLREEIQYLRNLLDSVTKKSWALCLNKVAL